MVYISCIFFLLLLNYLLSYSTIHCISDINNKPNIQLGTITTLVPQYGPDTGNTRLYFTGYGLPLFAKDITVTFGKFGKRICKKVRIEKPLRSFSCVMPKCPHCGIVQVTPFLQGLPIPSTTTMTYTFTSTCDAGVIPLLPPKRTGRENCTVCTTVVAGTLSILGDTVRGADLRSALRKVCDSSHFRSYGRAGELYCREDLLGLCLQLYHSQAPTIADIIWNYWDEYYELGLLPEKVCREISWCPSTEWLQAHSHEIEWSG